MSAFHKRRCLVLNKNWTPVGTVSIQRAIIMLFSEYDNGEPKARIIDPETYQAITWDQWAEIMPDEDDDKITSGCLNFRIPEVILLSKYDKLPKPKTHFSRRNLFKRDDMECQYCGCRPKSKDLTVDHVLPRSLGGSTSWENCVLACMKCNTTKANRTPENAGMKLRKHPKRPLVRYIGYDSCAPVKSWVAFLGDSYWNPSANEI